jgi:ribA/ribD-fused uncharacterized protein
MAEVITSFTGKHFFLSNFYPVRVTYEGRVYPTAEHAYVAAKTTDEKVREHISMIPTPGEVKRFGRTMELRHKWDHIKIREMKAILENKFSIVRSDVGCYGMLRSTAPSILIEGNAWGDTFWGQSPVGKGRNELGKLLMAIRDDITILF